MGAIPMSIGTCQSVFHGGPDEHRLQVRMPIGMAPHIVGSRRRRMLNWIADLVGEMAGGS
jgi:hypothetical protein